MADSGAPSALERLWQRGTSGWTGDWTVQLEDGPHAVSVVLRMGLTGNRLTVSADGQKIDSAVIFAYLGEIRRFTWHERRFGLRVKGFGLSGEPALFMDGNELVPDAAIPSTTTPDRTDVMSRNAAAPIAPQSQREVTVVETDEVIGVEEHPLDNRFVEHRVFTARRWR